MDIEHFRKWAVYRNACYSARELMDTAENIEDLYQHALGQYILWVAKELGFELDLVEQATFNLQVIKEFMAIDPIGWPGLMYVEIERLERGEINEQQLMLTASDQRDYFKSMRNFTKEAQWYLMWMLDVRWVAVETITSLPKPELCQSIFDAAVKKLYPLHKLMDAYKEQHA